MEGRSRMPHFYPHDLARFVSEKWDADAGWDLLPREEVLGQILSSCYQASLLSEEQRKLTDRKSVV